MKPTPTKYILTWAFCSLIGALLFLWYAGVWLGASPRYWTQLVPISATVTFLVNMRKDSPAQKSLSYLLGLCFVATTLAQVLGWTGVISLPVQRYF